jgi:hypothetical protein
MTQQPDGQFRGRVPGTGAPPPSAQSQWGWSEFTDRPHLSWFGVFLVILGALLLLEQLVPGTRALGSGLVVAIGVALLVAWGVNRHAWQLYGGAIITAISLPSLLQDLNVISDSSGWGTLFLGIAFLFIGLVRAGTRGGVGWQFVVGGVLALIGGSQVAQQEIPNFPSLDRLFWPAIIVIVGIAVVLRGMGPRRHRPPGV